MSLLKIRRRNSNHMYKWCRMGHKYILMILGHLYYMVRRSSTVLEKNKVMENMLKLDTKKKTNSQLRQLNRNSSR